MKSAAFWIDQLKLVPHPEGGYFKETYRCKEEIPDNCLPDRFKGNRSFATAIYFLLSGHEVSKLHRIKSDETWHFYAGNSIVIHVFSEKGSYQKIKLGSDLLKGYKFQATVKAGDWFGAELTQKDGYALTGCTVAPGFDFKDFEMAKSDKLIDLFPEQQAIISKLT
jgi:uncharacterized protein